MTDPTHTPVNAAHLAAWLPEQRWFRAKGHAVREVRPVGSVPLSGDGDGPASRLDLLEVRFHDRAPQHYQVVPGLDAVPPYPAASGAVPVAALALLRAIASGAERGTTRFRPEPGAGLPDRLGPRLTAALSDSGPPAPSLVRVLAAEQSNTSIVYDDEVILKIFRQVEPGLNLDLELHRALTRLGSGHVAPLLGAVEGELRGEPTTLGMLSGYAPHAVDGWAMALASVRDVLADDAPAVVARSGGDFEFEARRIGAAVGEVHADLRTAFGGDVADPADVAAGFAAHLDEAVAVVPALRPHAPFLHARYRRLAGLSTPVPIQRVHGDLHLGQLLRTSHTWWLLDFEGEPARPLAQRRAPRSPLYDVAGLLRSLDYATHYPVRDEAPDADAVRRLSQWSALNREALCAGYADSTGTDPGRSRQLLEGYVLDRIVYEVVYEATVRPAWLPIPLATLDRLGTGTPR
ncbi:hypothetical protein [Micromonospora sp. NPDC049171]|uniref:maltokinase N-terminal cap-like domain-containing protein n=1 Tax=Micromonospora sp. NPDC049171 TaxID=3155770 RepID=UPI0033F2D61F